MRVLVTGGSGNLGRHVVRELVGDSGGRSPHEVVVFDRVAGPPHPRVQYLTGDVEDLGQVTGAAAGVDAIIHLAAVHGYGIAPHNVTFRTNVLGTWNVHEAAWLLGIRRVISTSSESILGFDFAGRRRTPSYLPIDEDHPVQPLDPYGLSKQAGEDIARSYSAKSGMETIVLRPPWIPLAEQMERLRSGARREDARSFLNTFVDVRDLAEAYRLALQAPLTGHTVLFTCADDSCAPEPLCEVLPRQFPHLRGLVASLTGTRPGVSNARAKEVLGWRPGQTWRNSDAG